MSPAARCSSSLRAAGTALVAEPGSMNCCAFATLAARQKKSARLSRSFLRPPAGELGEELLAFLARGDDAFHLDVAVAADVLGLRGNLYGERVVLRIEAFQERVDGLLVFADQRTLGT